MRSRVRADRGVMGAAALLAAALCGFAQTARDTDARADFLRVIDRPRVALAPVVTALPAAGRYAQEHFTFASEADERVPGIAVKRDAPGGRRAAVIAVHGTGDQKEAMLPLLRALADRGFLAVAIDGRYHGEREKSPSDYITAILGAYRSGHRHPFLYDTVWDVLRLVDYLATRSDVDPARIGMMGISKGGIETYLAAAADTRIAAAVPILGVQSFRWGLEHDAWQARVETIHPVIERLASEAGLQTVDASFVRKFYDRVVPGIYGEFDGPAMLPLIAPRPLLVINSDLDELTPLAGVQESAAAAEQAYRLARAQDRFELFVQPDTGHTFTPHAQQATVEWFVRWLKP
jgi:dienelactone hydrolase